MTSVINYRFLSSKSFCKISFESTSLLAWELKSEIIIQKQMASEDFDLILYENDEELNDESIIYCNSSILVKRIPLWMAKAKPTLLKESIRQRKQKAPPITYVCFRCGQKGHFIQHCPTNQDKNFDVLRLRKPTGIPKAFLVETKDSKEGNLIDERGSFVQIQPQVEEWHKIQGGLKSQKPPHIVCKKCNEIFNNPIILQCSHVYCEKCVPEYCLVCDEKAVDFEKHFELEAEIESFLKR